jgi:hypothetical protein
MASWLRVGGLLFLVSQIRTQSAQKENIDGGRVEREMWEAGEDGC